MKTSKSLINAYEKLKNLTKQKIRTLEKLAQIESDIDKIIKKLGPIIKEKKKKKA